MGPGPFYLQKSIYTLLVKTFFCFCLLLSGSVWADQQANSLLQIPFNYHKHQILLQAGVAGEGPVNPLF